MRKSLVLLLAVSVGVVLGHIIDGVPRKAEAGAGRGGGDAVCTGKNGDVNADGEVNISDSITILGYLFLGNPTELAPLCATPPGPTGLPDTGQTACYNDTGDVVDCATSICAGQDGFYSTGCSKEGRFSDNGDGTVTDHCTGLMWQKDTGNEGTALGWCSALDYCENLNLAGHTDWRLPNVRELQSIVDYGRSNPSIDPVFGATTFFYWSSTSLDDGPGVAWIVRFGVGFVLPGSDIVLEGNGAQVRAVR